MLTFPRSRLPLSLVIVVATAALTLPRQGLAQACGESDPNDRSDAHLPAGYQSVRWGMSGMAVQALRGHPMQRYPDRMHPDVYVLHEELQEENAATVTLKYTFYKDRLMEVTQYLRPDFLEMAESNLLTPYIETYGPHTQMETRRGSTSASQSVNRAILERRWTWCDRFTEVVLSRNLQITEVVLRRNSRLLIEELRRDTDHLREVEEWTRLRELPTD